MKLHDMVHTDSSSEELINLTPLLDVLFVVLILFILIAPLLDTDRVELASKGTKKEIHSLEQQAPFKIYVDREDHIWFNHAMISIQELELLAAKIQAHFPEEIPQIYHDQNAKFGTYLAIKTILENAGFNTMDVVLKNG